MPSVYTFTKRSVPTEPNQQSNFGNIQRDGSKQPLTGYLGNGIQTTDATPSTAITSPVSVTTGAVVELNSPVSAPSLTIMPKSFSVLVSEISGSSSLSSYVEVPAGSSMQFDIANQGPVYLLGGTGTAVVSFFYEIV